MCCRLVGKAGSSTWVVGGRWGGGREGGREGGGKGGRDSIDQCE